jgi:hypothetical protein
VASTGLVDAVDQISEGIGSWASEKSLWAKIIMLGSILRWLARSTYNLLLMAAFHHQPCRGFSQLVSTGISYAAVRRQVQGLVRVCWKPVQKDRESVGVDAHPEGCEDYAVLSEHLLRFKVSLLDVNSALVSVAAESERRVENMADAGVFGRLDDISVLLHPMSHVEGRRRDEEQLVYAMKGLGQLRGRIEVDLTEFNALVCELGSCRSPARGCNDG